MKITKSQLKQLIKEEMAAALSEGAIRNAWRRAQPGHVDSQDKAAAFGHARAADTHLNPSIDIDRDRIDHERSFGPDEAELIEFAKELALQAGAEDRTTYDWREKRFIDQAKKELMLLGVNR